MSGSAAAWPRGGAPQSVSAEGPRAIAAPCRTAAAAPACGRKRGADGAPAPRPRPRGAGAGGGGGSGPGALFAAGGGGGGNPWLELLEHQAAAQAAARAQGAAPNAPHARRCILRDDPLAAAAAARHREALLGFLEMLEAAAAAARVRGPRTPAAAAPRAGAAAAPPLAEARPLPPPAFELLGCAWRL
ncbi:MAG: hypothetical protein J3K34DRAFT_486192 [Monoraphidium minutum]|nr:MAG: hypothetical protein J3K34DRAFT_486192 [Monoraphidium minutum]